MIRLGLGPRMIADGPADVVGRLADCHARIRHHLEAARLLAAAAEHDERHRATARAVHSYFTRAFPLHVEDEDGLIAPALAREDDPESRRLLDTLGDQHAQLDVLHALLVDEWSAWCEEGARPATDAHRSLLARFDALVTAHLELEERELFPRIAALPEPAREAIVTAMAAARRVRDPA
ncbi:MAG: hemerythrin domain-containing protein [Myxococcales bacterium]|nr:hemerythrin domain-containing protein [Myxococcales bacterium]